MAYRFILIMCIALPFNALCQSVNGELSQITENDSIVINNKENRIDSITTSNNSSEVDALLSSLKLLNEKNEELVKEIESLNGQLKESETIRNKQLANISNIERENIALSEELSSLKKQYNDIKRSISLMDKIIYKQSLLYPLERKYDPDFVNESLLTIETFSSNVDSLSDNFLAYKRTYEPLLRNYDKYNKELIDLILQLFQRIGYTNWEIIDAHKSRFLSDLESWDYYTECYINRNIEPYKSILYLDEMIDEYRSILTKEGNVKEDIESLLKKLGYIKKEEE